MKHIGKLILSNAIFIPSLLWAQPNKPAEALIHEMKSSTDTIRIQSVEQTLSAYEPKTKKDIESLVEAMRDEKIAPYAQQAVARAKDLSLGPALHTGLKSLKGNLKHVSDEEFHQMNHNERNKAMARAMNIAAVAYALGRIKYNPAASDLRDLLNYDHEFEGYIALEASRALGEMGDEQAFDTLMGKAQQGKVVTLSGYGNRALRKIIEKIDAINESYKTKPHTINDPRAMEIGKLAEQIRGMSSKDQEVKQALRQLLNHPEDHVRFHASSALIFSMTPKDKDIVRDMLRNSDPVVRMDGLTSLHIAKTWDPGFLPAIIDIIQHDPDSMVQGHAMIELVSLIGSGVRRKELQEVIPYLHSALKNKSLNIRDSAFEALRAITGKFYPYEGLPSWQKKTMQREPEYLPENESKRFNANDEKP